MSLLKKPTSLWVLLALLIFIIGKHYQQLSQKPNEQSSHVFLSLTPTIVQLKPTDEFDGLRREILPNGDTKITNTFAKFEITAPAIYNLGGVKDHFTLQYQGDRQGQSKPGPFNFALVEFSVKNLNGKELFDIVKQDYIDGENDNGRVPNLNNIKTINISGKQGYSFSCHFLVPQECISVPLDNTKYLFILTSYQDEYSKGYAQEVNKIVASIKFLNK